MKYIIIRTIAILVTSYVTRVGVPIVFSSLSFIASTAWMALLVALVIAVINHTIKPLFMLISIPINLMTLGLFSFLVNGIMILIAERMAHSLGITFIIPSLLMAIYFSIVLSAVNWVLHIFE